MTFNPDSSGGLKSDFKQGNRAASADDNGQYHLGWLASIPAPTMDTFPRGRIRGLTIGYAVTKAVQVSVVGLQKILT